MRLDQIIEIVELYRSMRRHLDEFARIRGQAASRIERLTAAEKLELLKRLLAEGLIG